MRAHTILNTLWAALPLVLAALALRPVTASQLRRFAERYHTPSTPETASLLRRLVFRYRAARLVGLAVGLSVPPLTFAVGLQAPDDAVSFGIAGYLIGAFVASVLPTLPATRTRSASLLPRSAADYLPRASLRAPGVAAALGVAATVVYALEPHTLDPSYTTSSSGVGVAVVAALATAVAVRLVVRRPQPVASTDELSVDDAMRSHSLHTLSAAGLAIALLGTAGALWQMGGSSTSSLVRAVGLVLGLVALASALAAWFYRLEPWHVRRTFTS